MELKNEIKIKSLQKFLENKTTRLLGIIVFSIVVIGILLYFISGPTNRQDATTEKIESEEAVLKDGDENVLPVKLEKYKTVENTTRFSSRDIFQSLMNSSTTTATQNEDVAGESDGTNEGEGKTNYPETSSGWMRLEALSDEFAVIKFDATGKGENVKTYELNPGDKFETNYMLVSLGEDYVVIWKGDERIELKYGETYYLE